MKTNAILPTSAAPSAAKPSAQAAPDGLFSQVLTREVAERNSAPEPARPAAAPKKEGSGKPASSSSSASSATATNARPADSAEKNATDAAAQETGKTTETTAKQDTDKGSDIDAKRAGEDPDAASTTAPAELLALVANLAALRTATARDAVATEAVAETARPGSKRVAAGVEDLLGKNASDALAADLAGKSDAEAVMDMSAFMAKAADEVGIVQKQAGGATDFAAVLKSMPEPEPAMAQPAIAAPTQAALNSQVQAAAQSMNRLSPQVGSPDWDHALGQKVVWMVAGEQQSASLTLNPPDLGPLHVVLNVNNSHATAHFTAAQAEVRQALEDAMPKLREMLGDAGIQLGQSNVSAGTPGDQQGAFGERQAASGSRGGVDHGAGAAAQVGRAQTVSRGGNGLVDTFA